MSARVHLTNMSCEVDVSECSCTGVCVSVMNAITTASSLGVALRAAFGRAQSYTQGLRSHAIDVDVDVRCVQVCKCGARVYGGRMYLTHLSCEVGECMCVGVCSCTKVCVSVMDAITTACD